MAVAGVERRLSDDHTPGIGRLVVVAAADEIQATDGDRECFSHRNQESTPVYVRAKVHWYPSVISICEGPFARTFPVSVNTVRGEIP